MSKKCRRFILYLLIFAPLFYVICMTLFQAIAQIVQLPKGTWLDGSLNNILNSIYYNAESYMYYVMRGPLGPIGNYNVFNRIFSFVRENFLNVTIDVLFINFLSWWAIAWIPTALVINTIPSVFVFLYSIFTKFLDKIEA